MPTEPLRYGAYFCLSEPDATDVPALAEHLGLVNEYTADDEELERSIAYLRRVGLTPGDTEDRGLATAAAVVHVAAPDPEPVEEFRAALSRHHALTGVVSELRYTSPHMFAYAYERRVLQQPGPAMPNAFLLPMSKTADWWQKDWMERHTYFLPRYDADGAMQEPGHALAAADGIECLLRRTYKHESEPAPEGAYDFITYFECADDDVGRFHDVCAALRATPEWSYVRMGPMWHGRRVATWDELRSVAASSGERLASRPPS